jgi:CBS domain-containing protein
MTTAYTEKPVIGARLSQAAPILPPTTKEIGEGTYGKAPPVSAATIPSVYNKKLNKMFRGRLVVLPGDFTVAEALRRMARFNISSVPVTKSKKDNTILGFVDMLDFLAYLLSLTGTEARSEQEIDSQKFKSMTETFRKTPISKVVDFSGKDPFYVMHGDESLADAVQHYLKGVHRIAITDDSGDIIGVVSQWTIINYLATVPTDDKEWIPLVRAQVGSVNFTEKLVTLNGKESALRSFQKMHENKLSAIAVVDDSGKLTGNLSASDLKGFQLFLEDFKDLLQPVSQFLGIVRKKQGRNENFVVAVPPNLPMKDLIYIFNEEIVHRAYIADENNKPIGVFSLTDLMKQLIVDTHSIPTFAKPTAMAAMSE